MRLIQLNGIIKKYGSRSVLNGIDLVLNTKEIYGLVGINGAGKTTLLNIIAGILDVDSGTRLYDSIPYGHDFMETGDLGYLPDIPSFYEYLKVSEYIEFLKSAIPAGKINRFAKDLLMSSQIDPEVKISALSRGNRQKLGIISAVMGSPKLLLLDEPTSALDPVGRMEVLKLIRQLRDEDIAIMLSTHILTDMEVVCDRIGFLHNGVLSREINMQPSDSDDLCYEISLSCKPNKLFLRHMQTCLPGFVLEPEKDKNRIYIRECQHGEHLSQAKLFMALSCCGTNILKVEKKNRYDLNRIMEEVVKE